MADLKNDKLKKDKKPVREKYPVSVVFDGDVEQAIRSRAKELGLGVAPYIKNCVMKDLNSK